jgi:DNA-binding SARP family transcriptional activator
MRNDDGGPVGREGQTSAGMEAELAAELIAHHHAAIVVQDAAGQVVASNRAAAELLGDALLVDVGAQVGCALLGCRAPETRLADVCVHEVALATDGPLPTLRVDLPAGSRFDVASATVTALPGGELVVTELRREIGHLARERPGSPPWTAEPQLRLFTLGRTCVMNGDEVLDGRWLNNRSGHILKLLVAERHRNVFSDEIISQLWPPNSSPDTRGVRYFVHELRDQLEPGGAVEPPSSFVSSTRGGYALDRGRVWVDADAFESLVTQGCAAAGSDDGAARKLIRQGLELYGGDFLADEPYAEWVLHERDRLRDMVAAALRTLTDIETRCDDLAAATAALIRLSALEPFDIDVHRELFGLLLQRGRRSEALRRYESLRRRMLSTFDEPLGFSLAQLI